MAVMVPLPSPEGQFEPRHRQKLTCRAAASKQVTVPAGRTLTSRWPPLANTLAFLLGSVVFIVVPGMVVGGTNPKAVVFFAAVLPQFVDTTAGSSTAQMLVLGLLFVRLASGLDSMWGLASGSARAWLARSPQQ